MNEDPYLTLRLERLVVDEVDALALRFVGQMPEDPELREILLAGDRPGISRSKVVRAGLLLLRRLCPVETAPAPAEE